MVELREAVYEDCANIAALHAESWQRAYRGILSDDFLDHFVLEDRLAVWSERFSAPKKNQRFDCEIFLYSKRFVDLRAASPLFMIHQDWGAGLERIFGM